MDIFVSRPTWVHPDFVPGLDGFIRLLRGMDLRPRTLGATDYASRAPLDEVITLLDECAGAVILGYPQIRVSDGWVKDRPVSEEILLATEWNHIEAGLAYARVLPLLVIHHIGVKRGIFDRGATGTFLYERDLQQPHWPLTEDLQGAIAKWKHDCLQPIAPAYNLGSLQSGLPACPNCSIAGKPFLMSPIPPDFVAIQEATHECTRCHFKLPR